MAKKEQTTPEVETNTVADNTVPETVAKSEYDALFNQAQNIINNLNNQVNQLQTEINDLKSDKVYLKGYIDRLISEKTTAAENTK